MDTSHSAEEIFSEALDVPVDELTSFLEGRCRGDLELIDEVRSLLAAHEGATDFLEQPAGVVFSTEVASPEQQSRVGQTVGLFTLTGVLGEGGCGTVYVARQERPVRRTVAVKVVRSGMRSKEMIARFEVERQALVLLNHPNIAALFEAGETSDGLPYFAMEYVPGHPLTTHCQVRGLSTAAKLDLFALVCAAVQHAHQQGIIHRDLKPSNILVRSDDATDVPKVIDFGIAKSNMGKLTDRTIVTQAGSPVGTLEYMSPEQLDAIAGPVDVRMDVYSLGVILYELLTGHRPYELSDLSLVAAARRIFEHEPPRASTRLRTNRAAGYPPGAWRELRGELDWIIRKAMDKDPARRYMSVSELAADIRRYRTHQPVEAGPPSAIYRFRKFLVRNRALSAAATIVALSLMVATIVSVRSASVARRAERDAKAAADQSDRAAYRSSIALANSKLKTDPRQARTWLDYAPKRLQDWEWSYLNSRVEVASTLYDGSRGVSALAASSDGQQIAVGLGSGGILIWNHGKPGELKGHTLRVQDLAFAPGSDKLASVSTDGSVRVWNLESGEGTIVGRHESGVAAVAFDARGTRIASGGVDKTVKVWGADFKELNSFTCPDKIYGLAFLGPDGEQLVSSTADGYIQLWSLAENSNVRQWQGATAGISSLVAVGNNELLTGSLDGSVARWDVNTGECLHKYVSSGHSTVCSVSLHPGGDLVAVGNQEGDTTVFDRLSGNRIETLPGQGQFVQAAFVGNSNVLVTAAWAGTVKLWQMGPSQASRQIKAAGRSLGIAFGGSSSQITSIAQNGRWGQFGVDTGRETARRDLFPCTAAGFGGSGRWLALGDSSGRVELFESDSGRSVQRFDAGAPVNVTAASADGRTVAIGCESRVMICKVGSQAPLGQVQVPVGATAIAVSPDGSVVIAGFRDGSASMWQSDRGFVSIGAWGAPVTAAVFGPLGDVVALGFAENAIATLRLIRIADMSEVWATGGVGFGVGTLAFSPLGQRLASSGNQHAVRLWDRTDGREVYTVEGLDQDAYGLAFSADGNSLAAWTLTGSILVYGDPLPPKPLGRLLDR